MEEYDCLKLENQICFPLYAASKEIIRKYKPFLDEIDLTYTQYIVMLVLWEVKETNVKALGEKLFLDSGTLTPLLKKLEEKGYITRTKLSSDERNLIIKITNLGEILKIKAKEIPKKMGKCIQLDKEDAIALYTILYKILGTEKNED